LDFIFFFFFFYFNINIKDGGISQNTKHQKGKSEPARKVGA
jgi:hypothetical protein